MNARIKGRLERLPMQMAKLVARIEASPNDPNVEAWKTHWLECQQSMKNIRDHGRETAAPPNQGVEVDVPTTPFQVRK